MLHNPARPPPSPGLPSPGLFLGAFFLRRDITELIAIPRLPNITKGEAGITVARRRGTAPGRVEDAIGVHMTLACPLWSVGRHGAAHP